MVLYNGSPIPWRKCRGLSGCRGWKRPLPCKLSRRLNDPASVTLLAGLEVVPDTVDGRIASVDSGPGGEEQELSTAGRIDRELDAGSRVGATLARPDRQTHAAYAIRWRALGGWRWRRGLSGRRRRDSSGNRCGRCGLSGRRCGGRGTSRGWPGRGRWHSSCSRGVGSTCGRWHRCTHGNGVSAAAGMVAAIGVWVAAVDAGSGVPESEGLSLQADTAKMSRSPRRTARGSEGQATLTTSTGLGETGPMTRKNPGRRTPTTGTKGNPTTDMCSFRPIMCLLPFPILALLSCFANAFCPYDCR